ERPDIFYKIDKERNGISKGLASKIVEKYPEISYGWLLTGSGSMLSSENKFDAVINMDFPDLCEQDTVTDIKRLYSDNGYTRESFSALLRIDSEALRKLEIYETDINKEQFEILINTFGEETFNRYTITKPIKTTGSVEKSERLHRLKEAIDNPYLKKELSDTEKFILLNENLNIIVKSNAKLIDNNEKVVDGNLKLIETNNELAKSIIEITKNYLKPNI
ncbi:MAG: hypothetical protein ACOYOV_15965, partial [Bacteroidales bacterium]